MVAWDATNRNCPYLFDFEPLLPVLGGHRALVCTDSLTLWWVNIHCSRHSPLGLRWLQSWCRRRYRVSRASVYFVETMSELGFDDSAAHATNLSANFYTHFKTAKYGRFSFSKKH